MDNKYLTEITERANKATPGPWKIIDKGNTVKSFAVVSEAYIGIPQQMICPNMSPKTANAEFIANARTDVPALIAEVERLTQQNNSLSAALDDTIATQHYLQGENDTLTAQLAEAKAKLKAYEDAEIDGRLIITPPLGEEDYEGLKGKYFVFKAKNNEPVTDCFVLRPTKDKAARMALLTYARNCNNPDLAHDIRGWVISIAKESAI